MPIEAIAESTRSGTDTLFTPEEAAAFLTLSVRTLEAWRRTGDGPTWVRIGLRRTAYPRSECEAWMAGRRCKAVKVRKANKHALSEAA